MQVKSRLGIGGRFRVKCYDKNGILKWEQFARNGFTDLGRNLQLNIGLGSVAKASYYLGLIRDDSYTGLDHEDTIASHGGWQEADEYDETTRPAITFGTAAAGVISNASAVQFTISGTETMKGVFVVTNSEKSGVGGVLLCTGLFTGGDQPVNDGDIIKVTYSCTLAAA